MSIFYYKTKESDTPLLRKAGKIPTDLKKRRQKGEIFRNFCEKMENFAFQGFSDDFYSPGLACEMDCES